MSSCDKSTKIKFAFLLLTDIHIMGTIKFVFSDIESSYKNSDIYVSDEIIDSKRKIELLSKSNAFCHVYKVKASLITELQNKSMLAFRLNNVCATLNKNSFGKYIEKKNKNTKYNILVITSDTVLNIAFVRYYGHEKLYYLEDGVGSYFGNVRKMTTSHSRDLVLKVLGAKEEPMAMYLNCPDIYTGDLTNIICAIPNEDNKVINDFIDKLYDARSDVNYDPMNVIYLDQPLSIIKNITRGKETEENILSLLYDEFQNDLLIRKHPKTVGNRDHLSKKIQYDNFGGQWETACVRKLHDTNILVGFHSTALISPKLISNKEPYVVFLYKLFGFKGEEKLDTFVCKISNMYKDKKKVFVPETIDELVRVLHVIESRRKVQR